MLRNLSIPRAFGIITALLLIGFILVVNIFFNPPVPIALVLYFCAFLFLALLVTFVITRSLKK